MLRGVAATGFDPMVMISHSAAGGRSGGSGGPIYSPQRAEVEFTSELLAPNLRMTGRSLKGRGRGSNKGPITVAMRVSGRCKKPSMVPDFNKLRQNVGLSRQRSRVH